MIIIDGGCFVQMLLGTITAKGSKSSQEEKTNIARHVVINNILQWKKKFQKQYGSTIVLAWDYTQSLYWRRKYFPYYKFKRKETREKNPIIIDVFNALDTVKNELNDYFPWINICIEMAEADDICSVLAEYSYKKSQNEENFFTENTLVISHDHDLQQLTKFSNVDVYSLSKNKILKISEKEYLEMMITHIIKGDSGDGVPNIYSPDDIFLQEGIRQKPVTKRTLEKFFEEGIDACSNEIEKERFIRNKTLVDLTQIPIDLKKEIARDYINKMKLERNNNVLTYIQEHQLSNLLDKINYV